jgi:nitrate reductase gamma subunit
MTWFLPGLFYACAAVFVVGLAGRLAAWGRAPAPLKIVLTPGPTTGAGVARRLAGEVLLFRSLGRADRWLWAWAWLFHLSLVLLAAGHVGGLVVPGFARRLLGLDAAQFHHLAQVAGGIFGVVAVLPVLALLARRLVLERPRYISSLDDYFALGLLLLVIMTGNQMRFLGGLDLEQARRFVGGLLALRPVAPPADAAFALHLVLVSLLLAYFPFSKLVHVGGIFFNPTLTQRNDPRDRRHAAVSGAIAGTPQEGLQRS